MQVVVLTLLVLLGHAIALRISNNLPMNSLLPSNQPSLSNLWPPPPNSNLQCQCTCEPSSNPGNHIYISGDINIEANRAQTTYTPDVTTTSFLTQIPVVLNNVEIAQKLPVTDPPHQEQALSPITTTSAPPKNAAPEPGKIARTGVKALSKGLLLRDRLKERRNRRIMLEQLSIRGNPAGVQKNSGTRYGIPLKDPLNAIPDTTTDRNSETRTETITTKSPMTGNDHTNVNGTGSNSGSSNGQSNRNGKGSSNGNGIANGDQNGNSNRNGNGEGNRNSSSKINGKTNGNGNGRPSAGNKNENKNGEQKTHHSNGKAGSGSNGNLKQGESRKQNNDNNNGNNSNNGSTSYKHVDGSVSNDRNDSVSAKDKMIIDLLQKLSSQTANNNNNANNNNIGGRISDRWHGGQANTGWNKAPSTYPTTTASGFGFGVGFGMPPMMGMGMGDWIPSF